MKAPGDNIAGEYVGGILGKLEHLLGTGGNINFLPPDVGILATLNAKSSIGGDVDATAGGMIKPQWFRYSPFQPTMGVTLL